MAALTRQRPMPGATFALPALSASVAQITAGVADLEVEGGQVRRDRPKMIAVYNYGFGRSIALCSCGWSGPRRYLKALAAQDAWTHSAHEKCALSVPLVIQVLIHSRETSQITGPGEGPRTQGMK
jgi:hypothetical protein